MTYVLAFSSLFFVSVCVGASVVSFSAYAISRRKTLLYLSIFILAYAIEQSLIFINEFISNNVAFETASFTSSENLLPHLLIGIILFQALWMTALDFFNEKRLAVIALPALVMLMLSLAALLCPAEEPIIKWGVYSMRQCFLLCMGVYCAVSYLASDSQAIQLRCKKKALLFLSLFVLAALILVEDTWVMLFLDPSSISNPYILEYLYRRNTCESIFCILMIAATVHLSIQTLLLKRDVAPALDISKKAIEDVLPFFAQRHDLSSREQEIVRYIIDGKTNDQIARELQVSVGTVKTHTHHIFKKTSVSNRKELSLKFWSN